MGGFRYNIPRKLNADDLKVGGDGVWMDINFGIDTAPGVSAPDRISLNATSIDVFGFNGVNVTEELHETFELNHDWKEGTVIKPHVHWYATTAGAGSVVWQLEYVAVNFGETGVVGASSTTITVTQAASGTAWTPQFASFPDIDMTGFLIGTQMHVRFFRDPTAGGDDYGADAAIATFGFHIQVDTLGSRQVAAK